MRITVNNIWTKVSCTRDQAYAIDEELKAPDPSRFLDPRFRAREWDGCEHFFNPLYRKLGTGLLNELLVYLDSEKLAYDLVDKRVDPIQGKVLPVTKLGGFDLDTYPYDYQGRAVRVGLRHKQGVFEIATNGGKTIIAAAITKSLGLPTLFVVGSNDLLLQTYRVFSKTLKKEICLFGGGKKQVGEITICTTQSVMRNFKKRKKILQNFQVVFWDEVHHLSSTTWFEMARACPAYYRFGLSGTAFDPDDKIHNYRLMSVSGPLLMTVTNDELIARGVSAVPTVYYLQSPGPLLPEGTFNQVYKEGIVQNKKRNRLLLKLCRWLVMYKNHNVLLLAPRIGHCRKLFDELRDLMPSEYVEFNYGAISASQREQTLSEFRERGRGIILATTIYDEGVDIPEINSLILAGGFKKFRRTLQRIGRALRRKEGENVVSVYDFADLGHRYLRNHSRERAMTCMGEGFRVVGLKHAKKWVEGVKKDYDRRKTRKGAKATRRR